METRAVPTPRDAAPRCGTPTMNGPCPGRHVPTPAALAPARPAAAGPGRAFDRHRWEEALIASPVPHHNAVLLGWSLAHAANASGYLPSSITGPSNLARRSRLNKHQAAISLQQLEKRGLIRRPDPHTWPDKTLPRPITLTLPGHGESTEPPSSGAAHA